MSQFGCKVLIISLYRQYLKKVIFFSEYVAILSGNTDLLEKAKLEKKIAGLDSERQAFIRSKSSSKDLFDLSQNKFFVTGESGMKYSYNNGRIAADPQLAALDRKIQLKPTFF